MPCFGKFALFPSNKHDLVPRGDPFWNALLIHGAVRHLFQLIGIAGVCILAAVPMLIWRLSVGPLPLDFLTPAIRSAMVSHTGMWRADLDGTVLALGRGRHMVELQAVGVRLYVGESKQPALTVPNVAVSFNGRSLLAGVVAPSSLRFEKPKLRLIRDEQGLISWGIGEQTGVSGDLAPILMDALTGDYDPLKPGRQLRDLAINGAELTIEDRIAGRTWLLPRVDLDIKRTGPGGVLALGLEFGPNDGAGRIDVRADFVRDLGQWSTAIAFSDMRLTSFSSFGDGFAGLSALDVPLSGAVHVQGTLDSGLTAVDFHVKAGQGRIRPLDLPGIQYPVTQASFAGSLDMATHHLRVTEATALIDGSASMDFSTDVINLGQPDLTVSIHGTYDHVMFDSLRELWPPSLATNARDWVVNNLSRGTAHDGSISIKLHSPNGTMANLDVDKIDGHFRATGLVVNYLAPMPVIQDGEGVASFDATGFRITVHSGVVHGIRVIGGTVLLLGLDKPDQWAEIDLAMKGSLSNTLWLIDQKPLGYATALGVVPDKVGGDAVAKLSLKFPLLKDLLLEDVRIKVHADTDGVSLPKVFMGQDMAQGKLVLDLDENGMDVTGPALFGGMAAGLLWHENFAAKAPYKSRYVLQIPTVDAARLGVLGLDSPPFIAPWLGGKVSGTVTAMSYGGGKMDVGIAADLTQASMSLPGLKWRKESRTTGNAEASLMVERGRIVRVPRFSVVAGDLNARGSVSFGPDGHTSRVDFDHFSYGRNSMSGALALQPGGGMSVTLDGDLFDASPLIDDRNEDQSDLRDDPSVPPIRVTATFKRVLLSRQGGLDQVTAQLATERGDWRHMSVKAKVGGNGKDFQLDMAPKGNKARSMSLKSGDAGALMRAMDVFDDLVGGAIAIDGVYADDKPGHPLSGTIHASDFNVVHTPALARLLTVAALTGVVDVLQGQGISFQSMTAPFTLARSVVRVKDAQISGNALGLTANGDLDMGRSRVALEGTLVPFYLINSALGDVPLLGWLLNGGEKGGGLVAFNFSMKGPSNDPDVSLNPLSALTPGFLRRFFDVFSPDGTADGHKDK